jgi:H/ACA ribonucleoprotein complex subunit 4
MVDLEKIKENKTTEELIEFGIINIDKPSGPTSFSVSDFLKKRMKLRKTSHFGTLDPKVTGVLPVSLNRACKLTGFFLGEDKTYVGIMRFHKEISIEEVDKKIKEEFVGKIKQTPPVKSRVKRQEREREIHFFNILEKDGKDFLFEVKCQGGTYIRKLVDDLGTSLGTSAHMLELRRTNAGIFFEDDLLYPSIRMYDFESAVENYEKGDDKLLRKILIPGEIISKIIPALEINDSNIDQIFTGKPIKETDFLKKEKLKKGDKYTVFCKDRFVGIYNVINEGINKLKADFVLQPLK